MSRVDLRVPFADKDGARRLGARYFLATTTRECWKCDATTPVHAIVLPAECEISYVADDPADDCWEVAGMPVLLSYILDLADSVRARLRFLRQLDAHESMLEFRIGERVTFQPDGRPAVIGMITRYNKKTVSIVTDDGQRWNVAPRALTRAVSRVIGNTDGNNVVAIHRQDKHSR